MEKCKHEKYEVGVGDARTAAKVCGCIGKELMSVLLYYRQKAWKAVKGAGLQPAMDWLVTVSLNQSD